MKNVHLLYLSVFLILFKFSTLNAQQDYVCGFDLLHQKQIKENSSYKAKQEKFNSIWQNAISNLDKQKLISLHQNQDIVYEIPLVFHIIHPNSPLGSAFNPTDQEIEEVVTYLNQSFAATYPFYPDVNNGGTKVNIQFTLAKRDPDCQPTNGIVRINTSTVLPSNIANQYEEYGVDYYNNEGILDSQLKDLSRWDNSTYYNIWVVNKIDGWSGYDPGGGVAGYAYLPGAPPELDGTVIMEAFNKVGQIALTHELGHGLALYHTFEDGCADPVDCATTGDY